MTGAPEKGASPGAGLERSVQGGRPGRSSVRTGRRFRRESASAAFRAADGGPVRRILCAARKRHRPRSRLSGRPKFCSIPCRSPAQPGSGPDLRRTSPRGSPGTRMGTRHGRKRQTSRGAPGPKAGRRCRQKPRLPRTRLPRAGCPAPMGTGRVSPPRPGQQRNPAKESTTPHLSNADGGSHLVRGLVQMLLPLTFYRILIRKRNCGEVKFSANP